MSAVQEDEPSAGPVDLAVEPDSVDVGVLTGRL